MSSFPPNSTAPLKNEEKRSLDRLFGIPKTSIQAQMSLSQATEDVKAEKKEPQFLIIDISDKKEEKGRVQNKSKSNLFKDLSKNVSESTHHESCKTCAKKIESLKMRQCQKCFQEKINALQIKQHRIKQLEKQVRSLRYGSLTSQDRKKCPFFIFEEENIEQWDIIQSWGVQFTQFSRQITADIPQRKSQLDELIKNTEKQFIIVAKQQLAALANSVARILTEVEQETVTQLICIQSAKEKFQSLIQSQKNEFEKMHLGHKTDRMRIWIEPVNNDIKLNEDYLRNVRMLKEKTIGFQKVQKINDVSVKESEQKEDPGMLCQHKLKMVSNNQFEEQIIQGAQAIEKDLKINYDQL